MREQLDYVIGYRYNARSLRTGLVYPNGSVISYTYDAAARLTTVLEGATTYAFYHYDPAGRLVTATLANGARAVYAYDQANRLTGITHQKIAVPQAELLARYAYSYDRVSNRTRAVETVISGGGGQAWVPGEEWLAQSLPLLTPVASGASLSGQRGGLSAPLPQQPPIVRERGKYRASFDEEGLRFYPRHTLLVDDKHSVSYRLTVVRRGTDVVLHPGHDVPVLVNEDLVQYWRGDAFAEEYALAEGGVEQRFIFLAPVSGTGDLVIEGNLTGDLLGGETTITSGAAEQTYPAVAANETGGGWTVAWQEGATNADIRASHADGTGDLLGVEEDISEAANSQERPALAYDAGRGRYLAVWADYRHAGSGPDVYGQLLRDYTTVVEYTYDPLSRLVRADYSTGVQFGYAYDGAGNRTHLTETTPLSGTVATTYTYDKANHLKTRGVSDGRSYTYSWSQRGELLAETTQGVDVRTFEWDAAGRLAQATVLTLTTYFTYTGDGTRVAVEVEGVGVTEYIPDRGGRILEERTTTTSTRYLYGYECIGEVRAGTLLYYLADGQGYVRQSSGTDGAVVDAWLFTPDGGVMAGPQGPVSHLVCGGVYDWSTGLIYNGGQYFDPTLGIWLALVPLVLVQGWRERKKRGRRGIALYALVAFLLVGMGIGGVLAACEPVETPTPRPTPSKVCSEYFVRADATFLSPVDVVPWWGEGIPDERTRRLYEFPGRYFQLGSPTYLSKGVELTAVANIPEGIEGNLYMVQNVRRNAVRSRASGIKERLTTIDPDNPEAPSDAWLLDWDWYAIADDHKQGAKPVKGRTQNATVSFQDNPGTMVAGNREERDIMEVHVFEEFKTYLVFEGVDSCGIPCACTIGVVYWGWEGTAKRQVRQGAAPALLDEWRVEGGLPFKRPGVATSEWPAADDRSPTAPFDWQWVQAP